MWPKGKIPPMIVNVVGPGHNLVFDASLDVPLPYGVSVTVTGTGTSKAKAQRACAEAACDVLDSHGCLAGATVLKRKMDVALEAVAKKREIDPAGQPTSDTPQYLPPAQLGMGPEQLAVCTAMLEKLHKEEGKDFMHQNAKAETWVDAYNWDPNEGNGGLGDGEVPDMPAPQFNYTGHNSGLAAAASAANAAKAQSIALSLSRGLTGSAIDGQLQQRYASWLKAEGTSKQRDARMELPAYSRKAQVLAAVNAHQV